MRCRTCRRQLEVGLLIFGMILFGEHQRHPRLIIKWFAPMCRHVSQLRLFAVPLKHACHRRLHVGGRARLFFDGGRQRFPGTEQRRIKTDVKPAGNIPSVSFGWLALPITRPSCSFSSPVVLPPRLPSCVLPALALQSLSAPAFVNSSLMNGRLNSESCPSFSLPSPS